eukprot:3080905-Rhodomonas_salina.5
MATGNITLGNEGGKHDKANRSQHKQHRRCDDARQPHRCSTLPFGAILRFPPHGFRHAPKSRDLRGKFVTLLKRPTMLASQKIPTNSLRTIPVSLYQYAACRNAEPNSPPPFRRIPPRQH